MNQMFFWTEEAKVSESYKALLKQQKIQYGYPEEGNNSIVYAGMTREEMFRILEAVNTWGKEMPHAIIRLVISTDNWSEEHFIENMEGKLITVMEGSTGFCSSDQAAEKKCRDCLWLVGAIPTPLFW